MYINQFIIDITESCSTSFAVLLVSNIGKSPSVLANGPASAEMIAHGVGQLPRINHNPL
jgi:hypothetical protein